MNPARISLLVLLPLAMALLPRTAASTGFDRNFVYSASAFCTVNNPDLDTSVRRRPTELTNVGSTALVITCGTGTDAQLGSLPITTGVRLRNNNGSAGTGSCTLVAGSPFDAQTSAKKTIPLEAGQTGVTHFDSDEFGSFKQYAFNCSLPAGWSILELWVYSVEEVGA